jgi:hypothetical protein
MAKKKQSGADLDENSRVYGSLQQGVHMAGYALARSLTDLETLIEGDNWKFGGTFKTINDFLASVRLDEKEQLRLAAQARKRIANRIKELQPEASGRAIAKAIGANPRTIQRDATNVARSGKKSNRNSGYIPVSATNVAEPPPVLSGAEVAKLAERAETKAAAAQATQEKRAASRAALILPDGLEYRKGDCRVELSNVADNSVPLILTDPPYGDDAGPLYEWLAGFAERVLIPGGRPRCAAGLPLEADDTLDHATIAERPLPFRPIGLFKDSVESSASSHRFKFSH